MKRLKERIKEITAGWINHIFDNPAVKEEAERRATICAGCVHNVNNICSATVKSKADKDFIYRGEQRYKGLEYKGCTCPLDKKTKSPNSECPLGKWL